ncbi:hypothetical protein Nisw_07665 [Candidatus Nitrosopumilus sp. SW]|uniref:hypothetical protein n=1 Tax=Candidatus Nitrosopumilus sp. SW TaxID=2508726 RepID=UPI0011531353|nr:hypothetical protein [Candidatus Nitrosopumilus sp. SW]QDI89408.1 hypothetical protein Nisw_07665 [Candidatus Nitrosopumilus sp. SW]
MLFFGILLTSGFPNFMMQEAHALTPTINTAATATTTTVTVNFNNGPVFNEGGTGTSYISCFRIGGNTVSSGTDIGTTEGGGSSTITLTTTAFGTGDTPNVVYAVANCSGGSIIAASDGTVDGNGDDLGDVTFTSTTDGVAPVFSSAEATSTTTVVVTMSENVEFEGTSQPSAWNVDGSTSGAHTATAVSISGNKITLTVSGLLFGETLDVDYTAPGGANDIEDTVTPTGNALATFSNQSVTNNIAKTESKSGGSGCDGDCEEPTLGVLPNGQRVVDDGFTYNGYSIDVERFFTPYPLITSQVGKQNTAIFKIYENRGPDNIAHFTFAFGLGKGEIISQSQAMIEVDFARDRTQTVTITDPENALDNVSVTTDKVSCNGGSTQCLEITINHMFREPLDFNIVSTDVWDYSRQAWQNYYNHGIEIIGTSMNPAKQHEGINQGHIYHLTETSKTTAVDEFGDSWTFQYGIWMKDYIKQERIQDDETLVFDRMHSDFAEYRENLSNEALNQLLETCPLCIEQYSDFEDSTSWEYGNKISKLSNPEIQMMMTVEEQKAQEIMKRLMDSKYDLRNAYFGIEKDDRPIAEILEEERVNKIILQAERAWLKQIIAPNQ